MENFSNRIKSLIAANKLEEALDLLLKDEADKSRERYNTLVILKGKLEMLEEQEQAGLLDFDDLAREKGRIAHKMLKILDDPDSPPIRKQTESIAGKDSGKTSRGFSKYLLPLAVVLAVMIGIFLIMDKPSEPPQNIDRDQQEESDVQPNEEQTTKQPISPVSDIRLIDFPNIDRPFNFSDIKYHIKEVVLERHSDTEAKLTLRMHLLCRSNLGNCYREEARIVVDGSPIAPTERKAWEGYLEHNASTKEELVFIFEFGKQYKILLEKNESKWERGFKIIQ